MCSHLTETILWVSGDVHFHLPVLFVSCSTTGRSQNKNSESQREKKKPYLVEHRVPAWWSHYTKFSLTQPCNISLAPRQEHLNTPHFSGSLTHKTDGFTTEDIYLTSTTTCLRALSHPFAMLPKSEAALCCAAWFICLQVVFDFHLFHSNGAWPEEKKKNCCPPFGQIIASRREHTQLLPRNTAPVSEAGITSRCISVSFGKGCCGYGTEQVGWEMGEENIKPERFNRSICSLAHGGDINPKHPRPGGLSGSGLARSFHTQHQTAQACSQQWFGFYLNQQQVLMKSFISLKISLISNGKCPQPAKVLNTTLMTNSSIHYSAAVHYVIHQVECKQDLPPQLTYSQIVTFSIITTKNNFCIFF